QIIDLATQLAPFSQLKKPIYSVMGNHDEQKPGPALTKDLRRALLANNVKPIDGTSIDLGVVRLAGIGDIEIPSDLKALTALALQDKPMLLLTHNPDSKYALPKMQQPFVLLAGHTHGGQVNLPVVTQKVLNLVTKQGYKRGLYPLAEGQLFVTSGIGMIGLPLRFAMPPTIDILQFE
ncbi:MAG: phosphohydrolase, partial [Pseudomonadales bacterium]|nr:phosphohydrolase [Pseudomonadales bacterium]